MDEALYGKYNKILLRMHNWCVLDLGGRGKGPGDEATPGRATQRHR